MITLILWIGSFYCTLLKSCLNQFSIQSERFEQLTQALNRLEQFLTRATYSDQEERWIKWIFLYDKFKQNLQIHPIVWEWLNKGYQNTNSTRKHADTKKQWHYFSLMIFCDLYVACKKYS